jgi:hypothetical protein
MDALKIADHHLTEYILREEIDVMDKGTDLINDFSSISFIIIDNSLVEKLRVNLKLHKAFIVE